MKKNKELAAKWVVVLVTVVLLSPFLTGCEKMLDIKDPATDPIAVFDEAWRVIDERYALFELKTVDWNQVYQEYRPRVSASINDDELFNLIARMLEELKDGHVSITSPGRIAGYDGFYKSFAPNFNRDNLLANYLRNDFYRVGPFVLKIVDNTGYIYYESFHNEITSKQSDSVFALLKDTKGLIIDVRNNLGGDSKNAEILFARFISEARIVKYEKWKNGTGHNDFYTPRPYSIQPAGEPYPKKIVVLTNRTCFSACNDFVSYMSELPNITIMGDQTGGGGGIPYSYRLANGWKIQYTASMTSNSNETPLEYGIEPDTLVEISSIDELSGKDPILEKAYSVLQ